MGRSPDVRRLLLKELSTLYPNPRSELNFHNEYQLIVSVVLSAQCTDKKVNEVTPALFERYPTFKALSSAKLSDVESLIRPVNYYKTKAKNLIALGMRVGDELSGKLPTVHEELIELPGVGRKTANVVLCEQGVTPALPVDTHVLRLSNRLGLSDGKTPEAVEEDLKTQFESRYWHDLHHYLILHGRRVCKARAPLCPACRVLKVCPAGKKFMKDR